MAEYFMTEKTIAWPENIAPYSHYILVIWEQNIEKATEMAKQLESEWKTVILDDRMWKKFGFGQKAGDCELFGVPNRIVISQKTVEQGGYELTTRDEESKIINF
jgi:prolyl-tRNA synthetase